MTTTDTTTSAALAERFATLTRSIGASLVELVELAGEHGYELPEAVQLAAAVMPRHGEPDPERCKRSDAWLDQLWQTDPARADLIENVMDLCPPVDRDPTAWRVPA